MKIFKLFGIIILIIFSIIIILLIASTINHNSQLRKESQMYLPSRNIVEVNGKKLHVYLEGDGDLTLVFMSGHGTISPTLDFKPLWEKMVDEYRIAVVEKSGYGWSEVSNTPRDLDSILEETRKALELSGEKGPYVLVPHSMSGLEAIYWAQKYPDEVKAIIGLDPLTPEAVNLSPQPQKSQLNAMYVVSRIGLSRFMPEEELPESLPLMKTYKLSEEDKNEYISVFYKSTYTKDMLEEVEYLKENATRVASNEPPSQTPMYFFISDNQESKVEGWKDALTSYLSKTENGKYKVLSTDHYVHYEKSSIIAEEAKAFLENIEK
jgi:pimeloyl-ACP methyl ester carboxylesterase